MLLSSSRVLLTDFTVAHSSRFSFVGSSQFLPGSMIRLYLGEVSIN